MQGLSSGQGAGSARLTQGTCCFLFPLRSGCGEAVPGLRGDALWRSTKQRHPAQRSWEPWKLPWGEQSSQLMPLCSLCLLFLSSSISRHPARDSPSRHGRRSLFAPWQHLRVSRMGWAPWLLLQRGVWGGLCCTAHPAPPGSTPGWVPQPGRGWRWRCLEEEAAGMCGGFSTGALWGAEQAEIGPSVPPLPSLALHHPCQSQTAVGTRTPKGHPVPAVPQPAPGEGSKATATSLAAGVFLLSL